MGVERPWNMSIENVKQIKKYAFCLLRRIFGVKNLDFVANEELMMRRAKEEVKVEIVPFEITCFEKTATVVYGGAH